MTCRQPATTLGMRAGFVAALAAGPVFLAMVLLTGLVEQAAEGTPLHMTDNVELSAVVVLLFLSGGIGTTIAVLPCVLTAMILTTLVRQPGPLRLAPFWASIGGLLAGVPLACFDAPGMMIATFAATGAVCALFARHVVLRQLGRM